MSLKVRFNRLLAAAGICMVVIFGTVAVSTLITGHVEHSASNDPSPTIATSPAVS